MRRAASIRTLMVASAACAGAERAAMPGEAPPSVAAGQVVYERILGSFTANHHAVIYLDPDLCRRACGTDDDQDELAGVIGAFERMGAPRGEAAARLNHGALLWRSGEPHLAYEEIRLALSRFQAVGDVEGMAHAYEWLGFLFLEAGATTEAGEQLAVAYQLFTRLQDPASMARVLAYGD